VQLKSRATGHWKNRKSRRNTSGKKAQEFEECTVLMINPQSLGGWSGKIRYINGKGEFERVSTQMPETAIVLKVSTTPRQYKISR